MQRLLRPTGAGRQPVDDLVVFQQPEASAMIVDPITEDAVFARLEAALRTQGLTLHRGTLDGMAHDVRGRFFITKAGSEDIVEAEVQLDRKARQCGVLKPNEALVPAHGVGR